LKNLTGLGKILTMTTLNNVTATCSLLICQKGACAKRGSKELIAILEKAIRDRHLQDHV